MVMAWPDRGLLTFMRVLFVGWRYQHIYISAGPGSEHYTDIVTVLFFFLLLSVLWSQDHNDAERHEALSRK